MLGIQITERSDISDTRETTSQNLLLFFVIGERLRYVQSMSVGQAARNDTETGKAVVHASQLHCPIR